MHKRVLDQLHSRKAPAKPKAEDNKNEEEFEDVDLDIYDDSEDTESKKEKVA